MYKTRNTKGFTLIEIIIVMIIVGVLATLGLTQYGAIIERSRGGEAKDIIGSIRKIAAAHFMRYGDLDAAEDVFDNANAGVGAGIPAVCAATHFFSYAVTEPGTTGDTLVVTATRCTAGGKNPNNGVAGTLILTSDFGAGSDVWAGTGGYN